MKNPWPDLPRDDPADLTLPEDRPFLKAFASSNTNPDYVIHRDLYPEPFFGQFDAPIVMLLQNPRVVVGSNEWSFHQDLAFVNEMTKSYFGNQDHFYLGRPANCASPGAEWWQRQTCRQLLPRAPNLHKKLLSIEFVPYHSKGFDFGCLRLPSQQFTFHLVKDSIKRDALILCARSSREWFGAVPELLDHAAKGLVLTNATARNAAITMRNTKGFAKLLECLA